MLRNWLPWYSKGRSRKVLDQSIRAHQKRCRRGKTGGPPKNKATFSTFLGRLTPNPHFLWPNTTGFDSSMLLDDPKHVGIVKHVE